MEGAIIEDVVQRLDDNRYTARKEALDDLKTLLQRSKGTTRNDSLDDDSFHQIFEALFRSIRIERGAYVSSSTALKASNAANRLRDFAAVFRLATDLAVRNISSKTANAVIDHVVDTLPVAAEAFCEPLSDDYLKILRAMLEHGAHVEHLRAKKWRILANFIIQGIFHYALDEENRSSGTGTSTLSQPSQSGRAISFRASQKSDSRIAQKEAGRPAEDLLFCLDSLTKATNAPILSNANSIMDCMVEFFHTISSSGSLHRVAFSCVNNIMSKIVTEDSRLAQRVVVQVLPIIRRFWPSKNVLLRDEMLITLVLSSDIIRALATTNTSDDVCSLLSDLSESISTEYSRRNGRDILQLDDILFSRNHTPMVMTLQNFRIRAENTRATFNWATVSVIALVTLTVDDFYRMAEKNSTNGTPTKRRKLGSSGVGEVFRHSLSTTPLIRTRALQTIPFLLSECSDVADEFLSHIVQFTNQILDEDATVASWTMIAISSLTSVESALKPELEPQWAQVWHMASRNLSNPSVSRCAAHLLSALISSSVFQAVSVSKLTDVSVFSSGLNGPVGLSDAALSLWSTIIQSGSAGGLLVAHQTVVRLVNWFSSHYTLTPVIDRNAVKQMALHATPLALLELLLLCTNTHLPLRCANCGVVSSPAFKAAFERHRDAGLCQYLIRRKTPPTMEVNTSDKSTSKVSDRRARDKSNDHVVIEMLLLKLQSFKDAWIALSRERLSNISDDVLQIMASLVVTCFVMPSLLGTEQSHICKELTHNAQQAWNLVSGFIELSENVDSLQAIVAVTIVRTIRSCDVALPQNSILQSLSFMLSTVVIQLRKDNDKLVEVEKDENGIVDIGDSFASYSSQANFEHFPPSENRQDLPFSTSLAHLKRDMALQLYIYAIDTRTAQLVEENCVPGIIDYLVNLKPGDLLASRPSILTFLRSSNLSRSEACRLLKRVAQACIQDYDFERCEASLCFCLQVMTELAEFWVTNDDDELHGLGSDMYEWFIEVPLGKGLASTCVLISLATLLQKVLGLNPTYNNAILPSGRTSFFEILRRGSNVVKFRMADKISHVFNHFVLTEHAAILNDVVESLPNDSADLDGIALRLYILAELAANWSTLLRSSIYHLFETPAHIPLSVPHAQICLQKISTSLELDSPQDLFLLFAPQLLYTWLQTETLESVPFSIYGFQTLRELIGEVQHEVVGQIVMRANKSLADRVSEIMTTPFDAMMEASLAKAEAYSLARDISMPPSKDSASKKAEPQLRQQLGNQKHLGLVSVSFPEIVTTLFASLSEEHEVERALARRPEFASAATNLQSICRLSVSKIATPSSQQPSFRAKYLLDEIEFLCQRARRKTTTIWTSPLVVYVLRNLFDMVVPALGSLHVCSTLRKVRIVVALAGQEALQGYALEMLLRALQPFLTDVYSGEDAIGLFWYLFHHGREYLQLRLSFLCEIALTTLLSLSTFLTAPQDSTTQEPHYLSTLSAASSFHEWFGEYLATFPTHDHAAEDARAFKTLTCHAQRVRAPGRANKDSVEGKLLLNLLEARTSELKVLSQTAFEMAVQTLCGSFIPSARADEDILWSDSLAVRHARVIWSLLGNVNVAQGFWIWSGEALGRAYAASAAIDRTLTTEHAENIFQPLGLTDTSVRTSRSVIMEYLRDLLHSNDHVAVSLAEKTLQLVMTQAARQGAFSDYQRCIDPALAQALNWHPSPCPEMNGFQRRGLRKDRAERSSCPASATAWASQFMVSLISPVKDDPLLSALPAILSRLPNLAVHAVPFIVHCSLQADHENDQVHREIVSQAFRDMLLDRTGSGADQQRLILSTLLYLRCQPLRKETTILDRSEWLDVDFGLAAAAASSCAMYKSGLMLIELYASKQSIQSSRSARRSSVAKTKLSPDLMHQIYQHLDDPDFFYGMQEKASLGSVMQKLGHEGDTVKHLAFQSAVFDANIKASDIDDRSELFGALVSANMNGVAHIVRAHPTAEIALRSDYGSNASLTALNLHQWALPVPHTPSDPASLLFRVIRAANVLPDHLEVQKKLEGAIFSLVKSVVHESNTACALLSSMTTLATLAEAKEVLSSRSSDELAVCWQKLANRERWQEMANFDHIALILAGREALFSSIKKQNHWAKLMRLDRVDCTISEVKCVRHSLKLARSHAALQPALNRAMYLSKLVDEGATIGLVIDNVVSHDFAGVLWDQGDEMASIQMLKQLKDNCEADKQAIAVSRPALLADMGHRIADARLERPDEIISHYLLPAIKELKGNVEGREAGRVYHEFAFFCDRQLQSAEGSDEFSRVEQIRQQKDAEVKDLERMVNKAQGKQKEQLIAHHAKAKQWFKLDDAEYQRLKRARENFLQQTLENYLLSLRACDDYANDVLRFCAMWLDNASNTTATTTVGKYLAEVASRKFVPLMNQLSSRLLDNKNEFQEHLFNLLLRICTDHPFHGMYQIFASSKSKGGKDDLALSRHAAANRLSEELRKGPASSTWIAIHNSNISFIRFALDHLADDNRHKSGSKVPLAKIQSGQKLVQEILNLNTKIPPPTLKIPTRSDCDYRLVPVLEQFESSFTIASGVSAPKIIAILASDGSRMKALLKGGNDDLRQDSIMEQVFEQVSNLLKDHRETRQRQLGIRTYKVLPLTMNAGIIEFVSNTVPLHEYSLPAHQKYHPKDWKPNKCRRDISDAQSRSLSTRIQTFRNVCNNFQPVLRHFFFERFFDPDDWFSKRLAYSRSTAAISILGHILGLGDRHGHNILLDEQTGEVVHIDLGVAFEAGRVLPVPEVVPFRLTRDIVDGMGLSGVEGVFRRCCNFTLEALRQDQYSIMTILDVLRYDPLYSWSISPLRLQRMQENRKQEEAGEQGGEAGAGAGAGGDGAAGPAGTTAPANKKAINNNPGEADRALTVVARKLGKSLSVEATVNELIQQAMDERNLAVLYCGWAAYA